MFGNYHESVLLVSIRAKLGEACLGWCRIIAWYELVSSKREYIPSGRSVLHVI